MLACCHSPSVRLELMLRTIRRPPPRVVGYEQHHFLSLYVSPNVFYAHFLGTPFSIKASCGMPIILFLFILFFIMRPTSRTRELIANDALLGAPVQVRRFPAQPPCCPQLLPLGNILAKRPSFSQSKHLSGLDRL